MAEMIDVTGEIYGFLHVDTYDVKHDVYCVTCCCGCNDRKK